MVGACPTHCIGHCVLGVSSVLGHVAMIANSGNYIPYDLANVSCVSLFFTSMVVTCQERAASARYDFPGKKAFQKFLPSSLVVVVVQLQISTTMLILTQVKYTCERINSTSNHFLDI